MGCGCKKKKQAPLTDSQKANVVAERRGDLIKEQNV